MAEEKSTHEIHDDDIDQRDYAELSYALESVRENVYKSYYQELNTYSIMNPTTQVEHDEALRNTRFFKINKVEITQDDSVLDKLSTVITTASSIGNSLAVIIESLSNGEIGFYIGVVNVSEDDNVEVCSNLLENAFTSHFPGSMLEEVSSQRYSNLIKNTFYAGRKRTISTVSGLSVSRKDAFEQKNHAIDLFCPPCARKYIQRSLLSILYQKKIKMNYLKAVKHYTLVFRLLQKVSGVIMNQMVKQRFLISLKEYPVQ